MRDASDHAIASVAAVLAERDRDLLHAKRALAHELRDRHGVGAVHAGGYSLTISWPGRATEDALCRLVADGLISGADAARCMPSKPKPSGPALKALIGRLTVTDPAAAKTLADACTVSPPSLRDLRATSVNEPAATETAPQPA